MKQQNDSAGKLIELRQKIVSLEKELQEKDIKLQKSEEKFNSLFNSITDMMLIIDGKNRLIIHANQQACHMIGYKNLLYRDYTGLFPLKIKFYLLRKILIFTIMSVKIEKLYSLTVPSAPWILQYLLWTGMIRKPFSLP